MFSRSLVLAAALLLAPATAVTQTMPESPQADDPQNDWDDSAVVITAHYPGPALWRVKKGEAEVYIVGGLPVMIKRFDWDRARVGRILDKANVLLLSPKAKGGAISFTQWQLSKGNGLFKNLFDVLPSDVAGHFWKTATRNGLDPMKYAKDSPLYAAVRLRDDIYEKRGFSANDPEKMLIFMARDRKTPMRPMASYSASGLIGKLNAMDNQDRARCVDSVLGEIDFASTHAQAATEAWATGDLKGAHLNSPNSATLACLEGAPTGRVMLDRAVDDAVSAIDAALQKPGKSVIVVPLSLLLRKDGTLSRLKAQGAEISEPEL